VPENPPDKYSTGKFSDRIGAQERRKLKARRTTARSVWFGFAMSGLIGWSVAVPMLLGVALGVWLDKHHPAKHSWTLSLLVVGAAVGCWNAWRWVSQEEFDMRREHDNEEHKDA
jgi:ATP synthase protein I